MSSSKLKTDDDTSTEPSDEATCVLPVRERSSAGSVSLTTPHCLVVSDSRIHGESIRTSATNCGWISVVHRNPLEALRESVRRRFHLAIVDVSLGRQRDEFERLVSELRSGNVPLVVVCGPADDETVEKRMWRLGIWSYVPGLHLGEELTELFSAARKLACLADPRLTSVDASLERCE